MTSQILALREHLAQEQVTCVVMEATSDYWKPFYYLLEDLPGVEVVLVNARHVKNLPGRKTDVADATWLAQLAAHGLVRGSFVPPAPIRALRDLTRTRTAITRERSREIQRLEKLLEDAGIKLSSVASDIVGVSGRAMIEALIGGCQMVCVSGGSDVEGVHCEYDQEREGPAGPGGSASASGAVL